MADVTKPGHEVGSGRSVRNGCAEDSQPTARTYGAVAIGVVVPRSIKCAIVGPANVPAFSRGRQREPKATDSGRRLQRHVGQLRPRSSSALEVDRSWPSAGVERNAEEIVRGVRVDGVVQQDLGLFALGVQADAHENQAREQRLVAG
jgi:hypothetical protein